MYCPESHNLKLKMKKRKRRRKSRNKKQEDIKESVDSLFDAPNADYNTESWTIVRNRKKQYSSWC